MEKLENPWCKSFELAEDRKSRPQNTPKPIVRSTRTPRKPDAENTCAVVSLHKCYLIAQNTSSHQKGDYSLNLLILLKYFCLYRNNP